MDKSDIYQEKRTKGIILTNKTRLNVLFRQKGKCHDCGIEEWRYKKRLDSHRLIPGSKGGRYTENNIILVCRKCHRNLEQ